MKNIVLIRHAKSDWGHPDLDDFDRPLNKRGKDSTKIIGARLLNKVPMADLIISSSAKRTKQTIKRLTEEISYKGTVDFQKRLYLADIDDLDSAICTTDNSINTLYVCSHNPGITYFVNKLSGSHIPNIPTCGVAFIQLEIDSWSDIFTASGDLIEYDYPKK